MSFQWRFLDDMYRRNNLVDVESNDILWAREYMPVDLRPAGFRWGGDTEDLISNFQKDLLWRNNQGVWKWKEYAINAFADELSNLINGHKPALAAMPCSKCESDAGYDSRIMDVLQRVKAKCPTVKIVRPVIRTITRQSSKSSDRPRNIEEIATGLSVSTSDDDFDYGKVYLVDDVLTTGATFTACKRIIQSARPQIRVGGIFWAKTTWA